MEHLEFNLHGKGCLLAFYPLLQKGFRVQVPPDATLRDLLAQCCSLSGDDALHDIQTIFLNGKPVDDPDRVVLRDGDTLALSAALPGLVGATMRVGGLLAGFRRSITYQHQDSSKDHHGGWLRIKLFNLLIPILGPGFIEYGVGISMGEMQILMQDLISACDIQAQMARYNGSPLPIKELIARQWPDSSDLMMVQAHFE